MSLIKQFHDKVSIHDTFPVKVVGGTVLLNGCRYLGPSNSELVEGESYKAVKMPDNCTFNGRKAIIIKGERWTQI